eukprot:UN4217
MQEELRLQRVQCQLEGHGSEPEPEEVPELAGLRAKVAERGAEVILLRRENELLAEARRPRLMPSPTCSSNHQGLDELACIRAEYAGELRDVLQKGDAAVAALRQEVSELQSMNTELWKKLAQQAQPLPGCSDVGAWLDAMMPPLQQHFKQERHTVESAESEAARWQEEAEALQNGTGLRAMALAAVDRRIASAKVDAESLLGCRAIQEEAAAHALGGTSCEPRLYTYG